MKLMIQYFIAFNFSQFWMPFLIFGNFLQQQTILIMIAALSISHCSLLVHQSDRFADTFTKKSNPVQSMLRLPIAVMLLALHHLCCHMIYHKIPLVVQRTNSFLSDV
jgi:hypothetical protein